MNIKIKNIFFIILMTIEFIEVSCIHQSCLHSFLLVCLFYFSKLRKLQIYNYYKKNILSFL